jgi:hypothetical protein
MRKRGLLSINPEPVKLVDAAVRDVWTRSAYKPRCNHEDGRGQCASRETRSFWIGGAPSEGGYAAHYCAKHEHEAER